ncbi:hypothetical protein Calab_1470 [Caldithrix abyssi DSM 13497]|uniref:DNA (Cytosine-5)-methyltransferase 1 n=1 Tax=Caldithrix abyssi DSM 13497 TaxID=880073 RepID=H1XPW5_CALAY|nr:DNA cytosine methyltransferase [Caldithrix abyssi]APF20380.1 DNA (cytosine-5)-methyltransferase 1 [Caldithrix abyssi DSM 13497]EHO41091.1 hypothetical protein Calab_1470 [Caldithrix abyssi DSM 13497]
MYKVLNLYAGIGGNRKLWTNVHVTAVEINSQIAEIYQDYFPDDKVIVADAHQYLLAHYKEYDFIWSSPPCETHSKIRRANVLNKNGVSAEAKYPDMTLYQEVIFLKNFMPHGKKWVVENVIPYYQPLIPAKKIGRHLFWTNFQIQNIKYKAKDRIDYVGMNKRFGFDLSKYSLNFKRKCLRNAVDPELGLHILNLALGRIDKVNAIQTTIFDILKE